MAPVVSAQELSASEGPDLSYVTPNAIVAVVAFPSRVLKAPEMEMLPHEVLAAMGQKELGLDPADVEQILVVAEMAGGPPMVAGMVRFAKPYQLDGLLPELAKNTTPGNLDGKPYLQATNPMEPSLYMPNDRTLLIGMGPMIESMVANAKQPKAGPLSKLLSSTRTSGDVTAVAVIEPVRPMLSGLMTMAPVPPPLEDVKQLPELVKAAKIEAKLVGIMPSVTIVLLAPDEAKAQQLETVLNQAIDFGQQMAMQQMSQQVGDSEDPAQSIHVQDDPPPAKRHGSEHHAGR
jgi:hypothetical protein